MTQTGALLNVEHIERRHMTDVYCRTDVTTGMWCSFYMRLRQNRPKEKYCLLN